MLIKAKHTVRLMTLCALLFFTVPAQISVADESRQASEHSYITGLPLLAEEVERLQPGLLPFYFYNYFARTVRMLPRKGGKVGDPILEINNQFGRGKVFGSGTNRGVGVRMKGALHFPATGTYVLQTLSNDGVVIYLNDKRVLFDPTQHSDQLSPESAVSVSVAGWYPIRIEYFQRKGTAALKFYWKTPGSTEKVVVPGEALGHLPGTGG